MQYRDFSSHGPSVSLLGFGSMRLPVTGDNSQIDEATAQAMVDRAMQAGINYYDTAWGYHEGNSQGFMGRALSRYPRGSYYLANKLPVWMCRDKAECFEYMEKQLEICGVERFDFYLLHNLGGNRSFYAGDIKAFEMMIEAKEKGKADRIGFSFHGSADNLERVLDLWPEAEFVQIQLNYLDWVMQNAKRQYEVIEERCKRAIVMEPVRGGLLAEPPGKAAELFKGKWGKRSPAAHALRFAFLKANVFTVLSGMSNPQQLEENIETANGFDGLEDGELAMLESARDAIMGCGAIPCTNCKYCVADCPNGIAIPEIFALYNNEKLSPNIFRTKNWYFNQLQSGVQADKCIRCGVCAARCPQGIDIPEELALIHSEIEAMVWNGPPIK